MSLLITLAVWVAIFAIGIFLLKVVVGAVFGGIQLLFGAVVLAVVLFLIIGAVKFIGKMFG